MKNIFKLFDNAFAAALAGGHSKPQQEETARPLHNKLLKAANSGKLGQNTKGGRGVISRYFTANRKDINQTLIASGKKPVHNGKG